MSDIRSAVILCQFMNHCVMSRHHTDLDAVELGMACVRYVVENASDMPGP
jgi:hypothetical protein